MSIYFYEFIPNRLFNIFLHGYRKFSKKSSIYYYIHIIWACTIAGAPFFDPVFSL